VSKDQESKLLDEESAQEKNPQKVLEIILSLAAAIHEQQSQNQSQVSAIPSA
jgi:hypothetical protein